MPIPILPGTVQGPCVAYWGSILSQGQLAVGALVADAFESPREFVWNDAQLPVGDSWASQAIVSDALGQLLRSISESLRQVPILMFVEADTPEARAWNTLRPLIPCAMVGTDIGWQNAPPPEGSPTWDLFERIDSNQAKRMFVRVRILLAAQTGSA